MTRAQCTIQNDCEFTDVQCHPIDEHLFATSDHRGHVCLRDARMAFGPLSARTLKGIVRTVSASRARRRLLAHLILRFSITRNCQRMALIISAVPKLVA